MRKSINYWEMSLFLVLVQIVCSVMFSLQGKLTISILPTIIALVPIKYSTRRCLVISFAAGFLVDFFTDGMLGLTSMALLFTALLRTSILSMVCGREILSNKTESPATYLDGAKLLLSLFFANLVFFIPYIFADSAGMFTFAKNTGRIFVSSMSSSVLGYLAARFLLSNKA